MIDSVYIKSMSCNIFDVGLISIFDLFLDVFSASISMYV